MEWVSDFIVHTFDPFLLSNGDDDGERREPSSWRDKAVGDSTGWDDDGLLLEARLAEEVLYVTALPDVGRGAVEAEELVFILCNQSPEPDVAFFKIDGDGAPEEDARSDSTGEEVGLAAEDDAFSSVVNVVRIGGTEGF